MSFPRAINDQHQDEGARWISRKERLLEAATHNNVETLKQLLLWPELYNIRDANGRNLLHIAISEKNNEVFDYLLSLDDFPLDAVDNRGRTALDGALSHLSFDGIRENRHDFQSKEVYERYAIALMEKGANTNTVSYDGEHLLHSAVYHGLTKLARLLIERGADLNLVDKFGCTPLFYSVSCLEEGVAASVATEGIMMLLYFGANPSSLNVYNCTAFDCLISVLSGVKDSMVSDMLVALENLFFFTFDEWSPFLFGSLLKLAQIKSPLFHQVIKYDREILVELSSDYVFWDCDLLGSSISEAPIFSIDLEHLQIVLEKYPNAVKEYLETLPDINLFVMEDTFDIITNLDMIMQSSVCSDSCLEYISGVNEKDSFLSDYDVSELSDIDGDKIIKLVYYFLSYGRVIDEYDLSQIYKITGYSESFKNLLFMDIQKRGGEQIIGMPRLIYDVTLDVHKSVENPSLSIDWEAIFHYFAHTKIQNAYRQRVSNEAKGLQLPKMQAKMPLLQELARDAFRKYFLKSYEITAAMQFYSIIKLLNVNSVLKKIITYEKKLYYFEN